MRSRLHSLLRPLLFAAAFLPLAAFAGVTTSPDPSPGTDADPSPFPLAKLLVGALVFVAILLATHLFARHGMAAWSIGRRLRLGFGLVLAVLAALGVESYLSFHHALLDFRAFQAESRVAGRTVRLLADFHEMDLAMKDLALLRDQSRWQSYLEHREHFLHRLREVKTTQPDPAVVALIDTLEKEAAAYHAKAEQLRAAVTADDPAAVLGLAAELGRFGFQIDREVTEVETHSLARLDADGRAMAADILHTQTNIIWLAVAALLLGVGLSWILDRSITRPLTLLAEDLGKGADQTAAAAGQVSASSQALAEGASEQAASMEESSASLEELSSMTKRNADHSADAQSVARAARDSATRGEEQIRAMKAAMEEIQRSSREVTAIIKTIDEIAFQTNILALNAAVEAARAGEHGAGFAVVADEVRALAQRSAAAAKETASRIESSVAKGRQGTEISGHVAEHFAAIRQDILRLDTLVTQIAEASAEQSQGLTQLSQAVGQIDQVTQKNAGAAEETAAAAEELHGQGQMLLNAVRSLRTLCGVAGEDTGTARNTARNAGKPAAHPSESAASPVPA